MKKIERLTSKNVRDIKGNAYPQILYDCYNRLAELEDKIEAGTLIELPCKVGSPLFTINKHYAFITYGEVQYEIEQRYYAAEITVCEDGTFIFYTPTERPKCFIFGKDIFTDKAQAEKRLKELQK